MTWTVISGPRTVNVKITRIGWRINVPSHAGKTDNHHTNDDTVIRLSLDSSNKNTRKFWRIKQNVRILHASKSMESMGMNND